MESRNKVDKYVVAVEGKDGNVIGHLPLGKSGKFAKTVFYFLKADKSHLCKISIIGKAINAGDGLGMNESSMSIILSGRRKFHKNSPRKTQQTFVKFFIIIT